MTGGVNDARLDGAARGRNTKLALDQLRMALQNIKPNFWLMPIFAAVICLMVSPWVSTTNLVIWFVVVTLGGLPQAITSARFSRAENPSADARKWLVLCVGSYVIFALSWASMMFFLHVPNNNMDQMLLLLLIGCTLAGNTALTGACRPFAVAGLSVYGAAMVLSPLREDTAFYYGVSVLALFYVGYMAHLSRSVHATARDMLMLRDDKSDLIDALERSKAESDLARERAETASRAKSQFLANMSHELRTPLNAILGFSEIIQSGMMSGNAEKQCEYGQVIHQSGHHLLALINDILDLAKIEAGGLQLRDAEIDLTNILRESVKLMSARAEMGGIELSSEIAPGLPGLIADERALKQVILNLLSNAVKFTPAGGRVSVFARTAADGGLIFGVSDTGLGIAQDDQERVFQSFGQGRHDVVMPDKGTGLGLAIVKGLVEAHDGTVSLQSTVGEGTTFTVTLPPERTCDKASLMAAS